MDLHLPWPPGYREADIPSLDLLLPFLEPPANVTEHVGWNGIDKGHPEADFHPKTREAVFHWPYDGEYVRDGCTVYAPRKRYPVVRTLFYHLRDTPLARVTIENICGNMACCNLDHWRVVTPKEIAERRRIVVYTAFDSPHYKRHS